MEFNEYQKAARETAIYIEKCNIGGERIIYNALGLAGEAGEVANKVKKVARTEGFDDCYYLIRDNPKVRDGLREELGDTLWYLAMLAAEAGFTLDEIAKTNLEKLALRHADRKKA